MYNIILTNISFILIALFLFQKIFFALTYLRYKNTLSRSHLCGKDAAQAVLNAYNLHYVRVEKLSYRNDSRFNPRTNVVELYKKIYTGSTLTNIAISAHEAAHAVQYFGNIRKLRFRFFVAKVELYFFLTLALLLALSAMFSLKTVSAVIAAAIILFFAVYFSSLDIDVKASTAAYRALKRCKDMLPRELSHIRNILTSLVFK